MMLQRRKWDSFGVGIVGQALRRRMALLLVAVLVGCAPAGGPQATPLPAPVAGELAVLDAVARPAPVAGGNGAVYLTVLNGRAEPVRLVAGFSPEAAAVELHETVLEGDVARMVSQPDGFLIEPGAALVLAPGGKHIMLIDLAAPLVEGETVELRLEFENAAGGQEQIRLDVPVAQPGDGPGDRAEPEHHHHHGVDENEGGNSGDDEAGPGNHNHGRHNHGH